MIVEKQQEDCYPDEICDICDGEEHKRLMILPKIDEAEVNITFTMNTGNLYLLVHNVFIKYVQTFCQYC